jgi:cell division protein FtsB
MHFKNEVIFLFIIIICLLVWCITINNKYASLKQDYELLKFDKEFIIDSLQKDNMKIQKTIMFYEDSIYTLNKNLINAYNKVNETKKDTFVINETFSESTILLKQNLL